MRALEMLLVANLLALSALALPHGRRAQLSRHAAAFAVAVAFAHMTLEGPRWQLVPAYGLTLLVFAVSMAMTRRVNAEGAVLGARWR